MRTRCECDNALVMRHHTRHVVQTRWDCELLLLLLFRCCCCCCRHGCGVLQSLSLLMLLSLLLLLRLALATLVTVLCERIAWKAAVCERCVRGMQDVRANVIRVEGDVSNRGGVQIAVTDGAEASRAAMRVQRRDAMSATPRQGVAVCDS